MNKRQKFKNGIIFKKCNAKYCWKFRIVVNKKFITNNVCCDCRHKAIMDDLIINEFRDIDNTEFCQTAKNLIKKKIIRKYPYMHEGKCLGMTTNSGRDYSKCKKCRWHYEEYEEA